MSVLRDELGLHLLVARGTEVMCTNFESQGDCRTKNALRFEDGEGLTIDVTNGLWAMVES